MLERGLTAVDPRLKVQFPLRISPFDLSNHPDRRGDKRRGGWGEGLASGLNFGAYVVLFSLGGFYVDRRRGNGIAFTLVGICIGLLGGAYEIWKMVRTPDPPEQHSHDEPPDDTA